MLSHISLFTGIGGIDLAAEYAGFQTITFCEKNKYCQKVLQKIWPNVPIIEDVKYVTKEAIQSIITNPEGFGRKTQRSEPKRQQGQTGISNGSETSPDSQVWKNIIGKSGDLAKEERCGQSLYASTSDVRRITLVSGGFPCQPHSLAGERRASADERDLWPEFRRVIKEIEPEWALAENVPGLFSSDKGQFFGNVIADLAALGYSIGWATYGAADIGAWHRRKRVFIVAHNNSIGCFGWASKSSKQTSEGNKTIPKSEDATHPNQSRWEEFGTAGEPNEQRLYTRISDQDDDSDTSGRRLEKPKPEDSRINRPSQEKRYTQTDTTKGHGCNSKGINDHHRRYVSSEIQRHKEMRKIFSGKYWIIEPLVGRVANGVPNRVHRLEALGNAVVPQQIYVILKAIADIENGVLE